MKITSIAVLALAAASSLSCFAAESSFPNKPIRFIVPFAAGGANDTVARLVGQKLGENLRQPVVIDNRPGGSGLIGSSYLAKSTPDGHTFMIQTESLLVNLLLSPAIKLSMRDDFAPVSQIVNMEELLVINPALQARDLAELIKLVKSRPGQLNYSSTGMASTAQIIMEMFKRAAGLDIVHVPYNGGAQSTTAVMTNDAQMTVITVSTGLPLIRAGRMRVLAMLGATRHKALPDVPTFAESGFTDLPTPWLGIFAPAKTPQRTLERLHSEFLKALNAPETRERLEAQGFEIVASTPPTFGKFLEENTVFYRDLIRDVGIKAE
jgi:tripartite-type tricarboxylate transporter receptor subunit TctC